MPRFRKGTTDHDNDGKMGGSLPKGGNMAEKKEEAKAPTQGERIDALEAEVKSLKSRLNKVEGRVDETREVLGPRFAARGIEP